jgi:isoquinoline 1-oxidoreductase beta subunit
MGIAAVMASPVTGGKLAAVDEQKAMAVKGVRQVLRIEGRGGGGGRPLLGREAGPGGAAPRGRRGRTPASARQHRRRHDAKVSEANGRGRPTRATR